MSPSGLDISFGRGKDGGAMEDGGGGGGGASGERLSKLILP